MVSLVEGYLALRRKLGAALEIEGRQLLGFARYADGIGHRGPITTDLAISWAKLPALASPLYWARRLDIVRRFARHRLPYDPQTQVPPEGILGPSYRRKHPYIYSEEEIGALIGAATKLSPPDGLRPYTYATLLGLLASTGLRIGEALRLTRGDVDFTTGLLRVSETKFHKSRLVPLHPSTTKALLAYAQKRDCQPGLAGTKAFFPSDLATSLKYDQVRSTFACIRQRLGWASGQARRPPRLHDLRHTFACRRLLTWYREGVPLDHKVPALSTYLGHVGVITTYWYFTAVPDLMAAAAERFERYAGGR